MKKFIERIIPIPYILPIIICFVLNQLIYWGTMVLCNDLKHYDLTTSFDEMVPFVPEWVFIYFGCYVFWYAGYVYVGHVNRDDPKEFYRFVTGDMFSRIICGIIFVVFPTTNVRPELIGDSISVRFVESIYAMDLPTNLFPSIHCLISWMCFIGVRKNPNASRWYKWFSCIFALMVVVSTQLIKQHYWVDAVGGIALAEISYALMGKLSLAGRVRKLYEGVYRWLGTKFPRRRREEKVLDTK